jgi:glycosidase
MRKITCLLFLLISFSSLLSAQEESTDPAAQKFPEGVERAEYVYRNATPQKVEEQRIEPPFWWVGMQHNTIELLIHAQDAATYPEVSIRYPGVTIKRITRLANPNYLFVEIEMDKETKPGRFEIKLSKGSQSLTLPYEVKAREQSPDRIDPLGPEDFIYLLMPDRFANGDPSNDSFDDMQQTGIDREKMYFRHGGDIQGILDHLDYIQEVGATALWINPLQENDQPYESYHGYAVTDHYQTDKRFGDNELYKKLSEECQKRGIKLVMDIIHNHVGDQHWFIRDLPSEDWIHQFDEFVKTTYRAPTLLDPYASDYDQEQMSDGWFDYHMPDLNQSHPVLARYLIQQNIWWIEYAGLDAYRIDTYAYPDQAFMAKWAEAILKEYPDFFMFAETWVHGTPVQAFFSGNNKLQTEQNSLIPGLTDFQLYYAINDALTKEQGWTDGVAKIYFTLAKDVLYEDPFRNVVFLDNHDLSRFYSVIGEDIRRFKCGIAFLLTTRGIPMMYYGTEILMKNLSDPDGRVREDFPGGWPDDPENKFTSAGRTDQEREAFDFVSRLANYRKNNAVLQRGRLIQFVPENGLYVYFRKDEEKTVMVAMNTHSKGQSLNMGRFEECTQNFREGMDIITGQITPINEELKFSPYEVKVWELR